MKNTFKRNLTLFTVIITLLGSSVCFAQQPSGRRAMKLTYKYPIDKPVKYMTESKINQKMDVMGQSMEVNIISVFGCTIKALRSSGENLKLEVTVDTIGQTTDSPMGSSGGEVKELKGKVFNVVINPAGKSLDLSEAESIVYNIEGSGESNLSETFINFFPVLPEKMISPGDTWNSSDSVNTKSASMSMKMSVNSENKLEGFETVDGVECAKISALVNGNRVMTVRNQDVDILIKGPFTGTATFFFSLGDGYFVRQVVDTKMTGTVDMKAPEAMSFPVVMQISSVNEVIK